MKPKPYFAGKAAADYGISLAGSFAIGDHPHDVEFAGNFGGRGIYVLTGHGRIRLSNVNGPKGGIDKHCKVQLHQRWAQDIVIVEKGVELFNVINRAIDRLAMAVARAVGRIRHRHWQEYHRRQLA